MHKFQVLTRLFYFKFQKAKESGFMEPHNHKARQFSLGREFQTSRNNLIFHKSMKISKAFHKGLFSIVRASGEYQNAIIDSIQKSVLETFFKKCPKEIYKYKPQF